MQSHHNKCMSHVHTRVSEQMLQRVAVDAKVRHEDDSVDAMGEVSCMSCHHRRGWNGWLTQGPRELPLRPESQMDGIGRYNAQQHVTFISLGVGHADWLVGSEFALHSSSMSLVISQSTIRSVLFSTPLCLSESLLSHSHPHCQCRSHCHCLHSPSIHLTAV